MSAGWHERLKRDRVARGLSQREAAAEFIVHSPAHAEFDLDNIERHWKRWERGQVSLPNLPNQGAIAAMFGVPRETYFPPLGRGADSPRLTDDETLDMVQRLRASSLDSSALDLAAITVDRLSTDYASVPGGDAVLADTDRFLIEIVGLRDKRLTYAQHREVIDLSGRLALLKACLHYDQGNSAAAEQARRAAIMLGEEIGDTEILGWGAEIKAWMALTRGDLYGVLAATKEGLRATTQHSVAVQLHAQSAKAWARLGRRREVEIALDKGRALMDTLPYPDNPRNHVQVDPAKYDFYVMDCYRLVGEDRLALAMADNVAAASTTPAGEVFSPMRLSEAELTRATVLARGGDSDGALRLADAAIQRGRRSLPSLLMVGREVAGELTAHNPKSSEALEFTRHLQDMAAPRS